MARFQTGQLDLFVCDAVDVDAKEIKELMLCSWFSLSKKPRYGNIEHEVGRNIRNKVRVSTTNDVPMATIWDHDVLLFLVSQLVHAQNQGKEIGRSLQFTGYEYHQFLRRDWRSGKHAYGLLWDSLRRLHNTHVQTSFYGSDIHHDAEFNWLSQIEQKYSKQTGKHHGFDVVIPEWIYQSVVDVSSRILTLDQTYFDISGGLERWLYLWCRRVSNWGNNHREHIETFDSLYKKSGSTSTKALFDHRLKKIIFSNSIPGYELSYRSGVKGMRRGQGIVVDRDPESLLLVSQAHLLKTQ